MGLNRVLDIAGSGLTAQRIRMEVASANLVNAETTRTPEGGPYRPRQVVFESRPAPFALGDRLRADAPGGVDVVAIREADLPPILRYQPGHHDADGEGFVALPNVNPVAEMVDLTAAVRSYEADVTLVRVARSMLSAALNILR